MRLVHSVSGGTLDPDKIDNYDRYRHCISRAEVEETRDVLVTLKFSVVRDLQNAGAFLAERQLFPSSLHHRKPFFTQVNHRYTHTVNILPERSTRDFLVVAVLIVC